ncbi:MAG TPA: NAD(P)-dependent oxidoreductase [Candidatus Didemnitutus sp.]
MNPPTGVRDFIPPSARILITGSNGFIGARLVDCLLAAGHANLRCFVRPSSRLDRLRAVCARHGAEATVEIMSGDLVARADCERAAAGATVVYHLAAGFDKSFAGSFMSTALATRNLIEASLATGTLRRFVNISTFAVYSNRSLPWGGVLDENCPLEDSPVERHDAYCFGKLKQDELVERYGRERALPFVTLRPGTVFGPGKEGLSGRVGIDTFGIFIQVGGSNILPLTYVDNCAEAIFLAGVTPGIDGEVFNIVDDEVVTARAFLRSYQRQVRSFRSVRVPYFAAYLLSAFWEKYSRWSRGQLPPSFNRRRCRAEWKKTRFSNQRLRSRLGWRPRVSVHDAFAAMAAGRGS